MIMAKSVTDRNLAAGESVRVCSYNVRHGDCTLVEYVRDEAVQFRLLVDAGEGLPHALVAHLAENPRNDGRPDIDVVMLSHVDNDHQGGLPQLLEGKITIGEYLGPCLPAFRRLAWLFADRVRNAVERAQQWEDALLAAKVPVSYPFEGYSSRFVNGRVVLSILSPASRLIEALALSDGEELGNLLMRAPLPSEWLLEADLSDASDDGDDFAFLRSIFRTGSSASPDDFATGLPRPSLLDADAVRSANTHESAQRLDPEFFGNHVLNDTSLVAVLDVHLGGAHRKRIVLAGDQENWSYIAAKHPVGLGIDVLKAPHHGGKLFIEGRSDAQNDVYAWLRPRSVMVSASGRHGLPELNFRNVVRSVGASLVCPNVRRVETLAGALPVASDSDSCFSVFQCESSVEKRPVTVLTLTSSNSTADAYACVQGLGDQAFTPIVVLNQNVTSPSESFVRWTQGELEKHSNWIAKQLKQNHKDFLSRLTSSTNPQLAKLDHRLERWTDLAILARKDGRHALVADPGPVLRFGRRHRKFFVAQSEWRNGRTSDIYRMPSKADIDDTIRWVRGIPKIYVHSNPAAESVYARDAIAVLNSCDWDMLAAFIALRTGLPMDVILEEIVPLLVPVFADEFTARLCSTYYRHSRWTKGAATICLRRDSEEEGQLNVDEWPDDIICERYAEWTESHFEKVLKMAERDALMLNLAYRHKGQWTTYSHMQGFLEKNRYSGKSEFPEAFVEALSLTPWIPVW